jgi:hypothetical protein
VPVDFRNQKSDGKSFTQEIGHESYIVRGEMTEVTPFWMREAL